MSHIEYTEITKRLNDDGSIDVTEETSCYRTKKKERFVVAFCKELARLYDISGQELKAFIKMVTVMDERNIVRIAAHDRKDWADEMGISIQALNSAISRLVTKRGLVRPMSRGSFMVDPEIYNNGEIAKHSEKVKDYNLHFVISLEDIGNGYKRKVKKSKVFPKKPDKMKIDLETGETIYARRGKPCPAPTPSAVPSTQYEDDASDIDPETGEVLKNV